MKIEKKNLDIKWRKSEKNGVKSVENDENWLKMDENGIKSVENWLKMNENGIKIGWKWRKLVRNEWKWDEIGWKWMKILYFSNFFHHFHHHSSFLGHHRVEIDKKSRLFWGKDGLGMQVEMILYNVQVKGTLTMMVKTVLPMGKFEGMGTLARFCSAGNTGELSLTSTTVTLTTSSLISVFVSIILLGSLIIDIN